MTAHDAKDIFRGACRSRICQTVTAGIIVGALGYSGIAVSSFVAETKETSRKVETLEEKVTDIQRDVRDIHWHLIGGSRDSD